MLVPGEGRIPSRQRQSKLFDQRTGEISSLSVSEERHYGANVVKDCEEDVSNKQVDQTSKEV